MSRTTEEIVYHRSVIEFVTAAAETCLFLERAEGYLRNDFISQAIKMLPLLYMKAVVLEVPETVMDNEPERFVSEEDYQFVRAKIEQLLGAGNIYLEVFHPQMQYSDTPIAAFVSEDLADIYQELKDFAANYRIGVADVMNDALAVCLDAFAEHWGRKLLNALRALHALRYDDDFHSHADDGINGGNLNVDRNSYLDHFRDDDF